MARQGLWVSAVAIASLLAVGGIADAGVDVSVSWTNMGCGPEACVAVAGGFHDASVPDKPATGTLYVEGAVVDTCTIGAAMSSCKTASGGVGVDKGVCVEASGTTVAAVTGNAADDQAEFCYEDEDGGGDDDFPIEDELVPPPPLP